MYNIRRSFEKLYQTSRGQSKTIELMLGLVEVLFQTWILSPRLSGTRCARWHSPEDSWSVFTDDNGLSLYMSSAETAPPDKRDPIVLQQPFVHDLRVLNL